MNIAIITPRFNIGGAETYIISKCEQLVKKGHKVIIVSEGGDMVDSIPEGVKHIVLRNISQAPYCLSSELQRDLLMQLSVIIKENNIDVIEAHNNAPIFHVAESYQIHNTPYLYNNLLEFAYDQSMAQRWLTIFLSRRSKFFVLNQTQLEYIEDKCHVKIPAKIIHLPILLPRAVDAARERNYLLSVGRLSNDKPYIDHLISGFHEFRKSNQENTVRYLHLVGDGNRKDEIIEKAQYVNNDLGYEAVKVLGSLTGQDLGDEYNNCYCFIGVGACLLIAAAFKVPIILASSFISYEHKAYGFWGCCPALDKDSMDGNSKYNKNVMDYRDAIEKISSDKQFHRTASQSAYTLFMENFSVEQIADAWCREYKKIGVRSYEPSLKVLSIALRFYFAIIHVLYRCGKTLQGLHVF